MRARPLSPDAPLVPLWVLALAVAAHLGLKGVFFSVPFAVGVVFPIEMATGWAVTGATLAGLISWVVLVVAVIGVAGRLRPSHLGLSASGLAETGPVLLAVWLAVQVAGLALSPGGAGPAVPPDASVALGRGLQAVFGSGLIEEVFYRGFLLTQIYAHLKGRIDVERALVAAVVSTSVYFGVSHVPAGVAMGLSGPDVAGYVVHCALVGTLFAGLFLRSGNLYLAVGAHALLNEPVPLSAPAVDPALLTLIALCLVVLAWPVLARQFPRHLSVGHLDGRPALYDAPTGGRGRDGAARDRAVDPGPRGPREPHGAAWDSQAA